MIFYDFEVYKYDWLVCYMDTDTKTKGHIVNDKQAFAEFYKKYAKQIWVGYNSRAFDVWIAKAILCDFDPYEMLKWIIFDGKKGHEFSKMLSKFPIYNYDAIVGFRSLKECEAFMGHDIRETTVPFDLDRPLTESEIKETLEYCYHDVGETMEVFLTNIHEFNSHIGLIKEFNLPMSNINKTKAQISATILGAQQKLHFDEFDITIPNVLEIGKYKNVLDHYLNWSTKVRSYENMKLLAEISNVPHVFGIGGIHGALSKYSGDGYFLMADVASYYPAMIIEYGFMSRNVSNPKKYKEIRDERLVMKANGDKREQPRKIVLNATFGALKDRYNGLYDPVNANNICIAGQLLLVDLLDKLDGKCELIQSNTDGILVKLFQKEDKDMIISICNEWSKRTRMDLEFSEFRKVFQKDVNNYIIVPDGELYDEKGKPRWKSKGAWAKKLSKLDNDLPIVNKALVDYLVHGVPIEKTIMDCDELMQFQKITKIGRSYEYAFKESSNGALHNFKKVTQKIRKTKQGDYLEEVEIDCSTRGVILNTRVNRCFASNHPSHGSLLKKASIKTSLDKIGGTPDKCFVLNTNVENVKVPSYLDKSWYIDLAKERVKEFLG